MLIRVLEGGELVCKNKSNELLVNVGAPSLYGVLMCGTNGYKESKKVLNIQRVLVKSRYVVMLLSNILAVVTSWVSPQKAVLILPH